VAVASHVLEAVRGLVGAIAGELGLEVVDVEFRREARGWVLRVYLDSPRGIGLGECQAVSERLGDRLDAEGLISGDGVLPLRVGHHGSQSSTVSTSLVWRWAASGTRAAATVCHSCEAAWTASALPSSMCLERSSQMA